MCINSGAAPFGWLLWWLELVWPLFEWDLWCLLLPLFLEEEDNDEDKDEEEDLDLVVELECDLWDPLSSISIYLLNGSA